MGLRKVQMRLDAILDEVVDVALILLTAGGILVGYGTHSWAVGIGSTLLALFIGTNKHE